MQQKVVKLGALSNELFYSDFNKYDEVKNRIKPNAYNFIFLDSLDTLGMKPEHLREFRKMHDKVAIITISQSTKDGKIRGSNELVHDSDIAVKVESGKAITEKNRYKESGQEFDVFERFDKNN